MAFTRFFKLATTSYRLVKHSIKTCGSSVLLPVAIFAYSSLALSVDFQPEYESEPKTQVGLEQPESSLSLDQQIKLIDLEILLLKAELAQKNAQEDQVRAYLSELNVQADGVDLPLNLQSRIAALKLYLNQSVQAQGEVAPAFAFKPGRILAVLPMSGPYAQAGKEIYEGLKSSLKSTYPDDSLEVLDSNIYDSMFEAWEWIRLYQPTFIFGPLINENVEALNHLELNTPMLVFNELKKTSSLVKSFVPLSNRDAVDKLVSLIETSHYQRIIVLTDDSDNSQALMADFKSRWLEQSLVYPVDIQEQSIVSNVDQALEKSVNSIKSISRKAWLQRTIQSPVQFTERPRQDLELVISFLPYRLAMQISPILEYYQLSSIPHIWLPSKRPSIDEFTASLPFWQATSAILPASYVHSIKQNKENSDQNKPVGIFYALGEVAAKAVIETAGQHSKVMNTQLGQLTLDENQDFHFYPDIYWLDTGVFEKLTD